MKLSTKPISSPGRTEKFPPPLMRFLKSNVVSRSRGRSRSSPLFLGKKNAAIETQEPSSPKVTCMGQVRVRRSSKQTGTTRRRTGVPRTRRCLWVRAALFCHHFPGKIKPKFRKVWRKWVSFFHVDFSREEIREDLPKMESEFDRRIEVSEQDGEEAEKVFDDFSGSSPPKNAFLLTRCRSAPYRSSSLASRFWSSPLKSEETGEKEKESTDLENYREEEKQTETETPASNNQETRLEPEEEKKMRFFMEISSTEKEFRRDEKELGGSARPLILTRCKSEPARTGEKLVPELDFWKNRRLCVPDSCFPNNL